MKTAVVIGGGVSGLASAYYIQKCLPQFRKVILLESSNRVGGWVQSTINPDGCLFEHGPRSLRPVGEPGRNTLALAEELGLAKDILPICRNNAAAKNRYLYVDGKLCQLPNNLLALFKKLPPFSAPLIKAIALEPFHRRSPDSDESVHHFVSRRLSKEIADIAVDALCRGIFAGDCRKLSVQGCFPILHQLEHDHGSIIAGMLLGSKKPETETSNLAKEAKENNWASWSLRGGLQQLTDAMAESVVSNRGDIRLSSRCLSLQPKSDGKVTVKTDNDSIDADLVISSVLSKDLASLLPDTMLDLKKLLSELKAVSVVVVNLEFKDDVMPVQGFGHLLPSSESGPLLGVVYDSCTFPEHGRKSNPKGTRLTVMMGGAWYDQLLTPDGQLPSGTELVQMATQAAVHHLGIHSQPIRSLVTLQKDCIPQYRVGHINWIKEVEDKISSSKFPLKLVGASYRGPAVNDCIINSRRLVETLRQS